MWKYRGQRRPPFAEEPEAGQESVWDYPRPPAIVVDRRHVEVRFGNLIIADSRQNYRILETASPPTFYVAPHEVRVHLLEPYPGISNCEWKGVARYWGLRDRSDFPQAIGWSYPSPPRLSKRSQVFSLSIRPWWHALLTASRCDRNRVDSMAGGSRAKSSGHSKAVQTLGTGSR
ncbi:MAG TPA: DUF427 domain-containing protein [Candidatus Binatia bacterium]